MKYKKLKKEYNTLEIKYLALLESYNKKVDFAIDKIMRNEWLREENKKLRKKIRDLKKSK